MIVRIKGAISNCYLVLGDRPVLVDTGAPGDLPRILAALRQHKIEPAQLALIVLTHGHSNHAGNAAELQRLSGRPVALHANDALLAHEGMNGVLAAQSDLGRIIRPFVDEPFPAFEPDLLFRDGFPLEPYGVRGKVILTPGHTLGSTSVVLATGDALIGDVLRGSMIWPNRARPHFFCNDPALNYRSLALLAREGLLRCHPGNFGSFPASQLGRFLSTSGGEFLQLSGEPV
ncbi:MAG: MBL fold metallo-hydrolase [Candidatus Didemnitutus sp.]|nr:MBL fold metallo-hydrolase [Candidatus Didemnitutus sp.]